LSLGWYFTPSDGICCINCEHYEWIRMIDLETPLETFEIVKDITRKFFRFCVRRDSFDWDSLWWTDLDISWMTNDVTRYIWIIYLINRFCD
jgi:hypothetical protein